MRRRALLARSVAGVAVAMVLAGCSGAAEPAGTMNPKDDLARAKNVFDEAKFIGLTRASKARGITAVTPSSAAPGSNR